MQTRTGAHSCIDTLKNTGTRSGVAIERFIINFGKIVKFGKIAILRNASWLESVRLEQKHSLHIHIYLLYMYKLVYVYKLI